MKFSKPIAVWMLAAMLSISCKSNETTTEADDAAVTETEVSAEELLATTTFTIEGMHCEMGCAGAVKKKLAKLEGVKSVEIDFEGKKATISHDINRQSAENLVLTVEKMSKDYIISDIETSTDLQAFLFLSDKDKDKKKKKDGKETKKEETKTETKDAGCATEAKKSCGTEKSSGCCASKKAGTL